MPFTRITLSCIETISAISNPMGLGRLGDRVWKSGFLRLYAEHLLDLPADRIKPFVRTHYWDVSSNCAAVFAGLILLLVFYGYLRTRRQA